MNSNPTIISVNSKETPGVGKIPRESVTLIAGHGVEGDYHAGAKVRPPQPRGGDARPAEHPPGTPDARRLFDEMAASASRHTRRDGREHHDARPRDLNLAPGTKLYLGESAVIESDGFATPARSSTASTSACSQQVAMKAEDGSIIRKAGIMAIVLEGGAVRAGDAIRVEAPSGAAAAERLQPV